MDVYFSIENSPILFAQRFPEPLHDICRAVEKLKGFGAAEDFFVENVLYPAVAEYGYRLGFIENFKPKINKKAVELRGELWEIVFLILQRLELLGQLPSVNCRGRWVTMPASKVMAIMVAERSLLVPDFATEKQLNFTSVDAIRRELIYRNEKLRGHQILYSGEFTKFVLENASTLAERNTKFKRRHWNELTRVNSKFINYIAGHSSGKGRKPSKPVLFRNGKKIKPGKNN